MKIIATIMVLLFSLGFNLTAIAEVKIGYVNMKRLLTEAPQIEAINKRLHDRFNAPKKELESMAEALQKQEKDLKRDALLMTESKLASNKQKLMTDFKAFREKEATLGKELQEVQNQELSVFRDVARDILSKLAEEGKYDLIVSEGVIYAADKIDITNEILERLKKIAGK
ncbi:MAG: OmpH family outer membrane protein [Gammaproteobacteria bacterium]|nr:OmpH family outer membrane protein [Gammaproteobacteria bacterium]MCW8909719.1 OmpH family outer membrane protein [Gammaproteobacteria bacterium]MCW9004766.1 OmpH family outer membrane protein [Gammaproteobacteria bacterium]MCW9055041.1 OmpH family outer membrane protein [Gammaproteobacteria bacterium]